MVIDTHNFEAFLSLFEHHRSSHGVVVDGDLITGLEFEGSVIR
jgi:hypothetical protein